MTTMKAVQVGAPGAVGVIEIERPTPGPKDVLLRMRACGICGTDVVPERLALATEIGADAVIDSSREDVAARLTELHGAATNALGQP